MDTNVALPADDLARLLIHAHADKDLPHIGLVGDTYTILPPKLEEEAQKASMAKAQSLAPKYKTEFLQHA
jgi:hypothetical protein